MKNEKSVENPEMEESKDIEKELSEVEDILDTIEENDAEELDLEFLKAENQRLKEDILRAYADSENTKKRCAQEIDKNTKYAISSFAKGLLSVADNLNRAIAATPENASPETKNLLKGVELTEADLTKVFEKFGITKMQIMETIFDPNFHQVVQEVEDPSKPVGTIISELQTGYMINDRILREAMVVVTKGGK